MNNEIDSKAYIKRVNIYKPEMPAWLKSVIQAIFFIFVFCLLAVVVFSYLYMCVPVSGNSMSPTLNDGTKADAVYISRIGSYDYQNIIVTKKEDDDDYVIKRLIAKGGDQIAIQEVYPPSMHPNGLYRILLIKKGFTLPIILDESAYLPEDVRMEDCYKKFHKLDTGSTATLNKFVTKVTSYGTLEFLQVPEDYIFYLGDNRVNSVDSSTKGVQKASLVVGRVDIIVKESRNHFISIVKAILGIN